MNQYLTKLITHSFESSGRSVTYRLTDFDEWHLLGGARIATHDLVRNDDVIHSIHLDFHGGRDCWHVENERYSRSTTHPREDYYGSLSDMMAIFERLSGQPLQEVSVFALGAGISHYSSQGVRGGTLADPGNPWELEEGAIYSVDSSRRKEAPYITEYRAVRVGKGPIQTMELKPVRAPENYPETFDPSLVMERLVRGLGRGQFRLVEGGASARPVASAPKPGEAARLYAERDTCISNCVAKGEVTLQDLGRLERTGKCTVASDHWAICTTEVREALLNDAHHFVRSCARISASSSPAQLDKEREDPVADLPAP